MGSFGEKIVIQKKMRLFSFFSFFLRARAKRKNTPSWKKVAHS